MVLAQDRDRFTREPAYHYLLRREFEEYGTKIRALNDRGDESPAARSELAILKESRQRLEELERDGEALMERYAGVVLEALENLTHEERHRVYKMLRLRVLVYPDFRLEVSGVLGSAQ